MKTGLIPLVELLQKEIQMKEYGKSSEEIYSMNNEQKNLVTETIEKTIRELHTSIKCTREELAQESINWEFIHVYTIEFDLGCQQLERLLKISSVESMERAMCELETIMVKARLCGIELLAAVADTIAETLKEETDESSEPQKKTYPDRAYYEPGRNKKTRHETPRG